MKSKEKKKGKNFPGQMKKFFEIKHTGIKAS